MKLIPLKTNLGDSLFAAEGKAAHIENIIEAAPLCSSIMEIILFGSSLEERCTNVSDIDLAIISRKPLHSLCKMKSFSAFMDKLYQYDMNQEYDRLFFRSADEIKEKAASERICREIFQKGKTIYRKEA